MKKQWKVVKNTDAQDLGEIMQQKKVRFAFASKEGTTITQLHIFCLCRDFLGDVVIENRCGAGTVDYPIYGFDYPGLSLDSDKTRMLINYNELSDISEKIHLLNELEEKVGWEKTEVTSVGEDGDNLMLVEGDVRWQSLSVYISLYSLLLRCLAHPHSGDGGGLDGFLKGGVEGGNEKSYLESLKKSGIKLSSFLLSHEKLTGVEQPFGNFKKNLLSSKTSIHNSIGIVNFADNLRKIKNPDSIANATGRLWAEAYSKDNEGQKPDE